ncbi:hypothetical protein PMKS-001984 [Pichia membranifaciens]|uniref:Protein kinase domain-containing protein n=1 Tax=Pichia membranifaciens TaxID=4926 RepID=A0A1Q2YGJ9_9ASCO|nr:hypothetical protein PMKS-001984 [Pichia membranifaciens]
MQKKDQDYSSNLNQNNYQLLSSTNLLYRENLPPEYRLPTLVSGYLPDLRGINTIDNEEQIPDVDFKDALAKFDIQTCGCNEKSTDVESTGDFIRKTYSENELCNYDGEYGRRKSLSESKNLILDWEPILNQELSQRAPSKKNCMRDGIVDEYIPNFATFNLAKFGISENVIEDSDDELETYDRKPLSVETDDVISSAEHQAKPIEIETKNNLKRASDSFIVSNESFKIAASPEREGDRQVLSSIPRNFSSLSFSYRRKMLNELLPDSLKNDSDYKNHISKIIRKNSISASSLGSASSNILAPRRKAKRVEPETNELGSIVLQSWRLGRVFESGSFGIIRECFNINDMDDVKALKIIPLKHSLKCLQTFRSEIIMWSKIHHDCIVPLLDVRITADYIFALMPLYDEGSLFDKVKFWETNQVPLADRFDDIISYLKDITEALKFLHENGIHHGDIKLENFLLEKNCVKLCDFGMTNYDEAASQRLLENVDPKVEKELQESYSAFSNNSSSSDIASAVQSFDMTGPMSGVNDPTEFSSSTTMLDPTDSDHKEHHFNIGSLPYASPELLQPCPIPVDCKADIWAFGILIYALVILKLPFWHIYEPRLKLSIIEGNWRTTEWSSQLKENPQLQLINTLVTGCLRERNSRYSVAEISTLLGNL